MEKPKEYLTTFQRRLSQLRNTHGITQQDLANAVGLERKTIAKYENGGASPKLENVVAIAKHFGVSCDYLLGFTDVKTTDVNVQVAVAKYGLNEESLKTLEDFAAPPRIPIPQECPDSEIRKRMLEDISIENEIGFAIINDDIGRRDCLSVLNNLLSWGVHVKELLRYLYVFVNTKDNQEWVDSGGAFIDPITINEVDAYFYRLKHMLDMFRDYFQEESSDIQPNTKRQRRRKTTTKK